MSRVKSNQKYMNVSRKNNVNYGPSKMIRKKGINPDYTKANSFSSWLFLKYDMSYKTFRGKSKKRREELKHEYFLDTGNTVRKPMTNSERMLEEENAMELLADIGVPFSPDGTPLGIGWD